MLRQPVPDRRCNYSKLKHSNPSSSRCYHSSTLPGQENPLHTRYSRAPHPDQSYGFHPPEFPEWLSHCLCTAKTSKAVDLESPDTSDSKPHTHWDIRWRQGGRCS